MNVGDSFQEPLIFNYSDMLTFLDIVKDVNPVHRLDLSIIDPPNNSHLLVQGMFAVCMFSGLLSKNFPNSINVRRNVLFVRPMFISDSFVMSLKVKDIRRKDGIGVLKGYIRNSKGKVCVDCTTEIKNNILFGEKENE